MKEEIYGWMKNLAVFYIVLTAVMNLVPDEKYAVYIRYFCGLLLILLLSAPILRLFQIDVRLSDHLRQEMARQETAQQAEAAQKNYYLEAYEREIGEQIRSGLEAAGYEVSSVRAVLAEDGSRIEKLILFPEGGKERSREEGMIHELEEICRLGREQVVFRYS